MSSEVVTLDVREDIKQGREPFAKIMGTVAKLRTTEKLQLLVHFSQHQGQFVKWPRWKEIPLAWNSIFAVIAVLGLRQRIPLSCKDDVILKNAFQLTSDSSGNFELRLKFLCD